MNFADMILTLVKAMAGKLEGSPLAEDAVNDVHEVEAVIAKHEGAKEAELVAWAMSRFHPAAMNAPAPRCQTRIIIDASRSWNSVIAKPAIAPTAMPTAMATGPGRTSAAWRSINAVAKSSGTLVKASVEGSKWALPLSIVRLARRSTRRSRSRTPTSSPSSRCRR